MATDRRATTSLDQQLFRSNFAQFVILTRDVAGRKRALARLRGLLDDAFPGVRIQAFRTPLGPPVAYPIQFRVMGDDHARLKAIATRVAERMRADPATIDTHLDWGDQARQCASRSTRTRRARSA